MLKIYDRVNWENGITPVNASNLNKMDYGLDMLDDRVIEIWEILSSISGIGDLENLIKRLEILEGDDTVAGSVLNKIKLYMEDRTDYDHDEMMRYIFGPDTTIYYLDAPTNVRIENTDEGFALKWNDPNDFMSTVDPTKTLASWAGTRVVIKEGSAPVDWDDGDATVITVETARDSHNSVPLYKSGLVNGAEYYIGIFPFTSRGAYTTSMIVRFSPSAIYPDKPTIDALTNLDGGVKIEYTLPEGISSAKIVYGGHEPKNATDGTVVTVTTSSSSKDITGLSNGNTYYFKIFVKNSKGRENESLSADIIPTDLYPTPATVTVETSTEDKKITCTLVNEDDSSYYEKIVFNDTRIPTSPEDGTVVTITGTSTSATFTGSEVAKDYYYAVYTYNSKGKFVSSGTGIATTGGTPSTRWAYASWSMIESMIAKHYAGEIDLKTEPGWSVGSTRTMYFQTTDFDRKSLFTGISLDSHLRYNLKIIAHDEDDLADGTGKAALTLQIIPAYGSSCRLNTTTPCTGGWANSELRNWLDTEFKTKVIPFFADKIKPVKKIYYSDVGVLSTCIDTLFIPSGIEITTNTSTKPQSDGKKYSIGSVTFSNYNVTTRTLIKKEDDKVYYRRPYSYNAKVKSGGTTKNVTTYSYKDILETDYSAGAILFCL